MKDCSMCDYAPNTMTGCCCDDMDQEEDYPTQDVNIDWKVWNKVFAETKEHSKEWLSDEQYESIYGEKK